nr:DUF2252 family protein [Streptomyces pacificus]
MGGRSALSGPCVARTTYLRCCPQHGPRAGATGVVLAADARSPGPLSDGEQDGSACRPRPVRVLPLWRRGGASTCPDPVPWRIAPSGCLSANTLPGGVFVCPAHSALCAVVEWLLGWTAVEGRPFQVRQFRNRKGSVDPAALASDEVDDYARMTGALLARAHAHSADPRLVAGYCGRSEELDEAVAGFAVRYADRTEADHADLVSAIRSGRISAEPAV